MTWIIAEADECALPSGGEMRGTTMQMPGRLGLALLAALLLSATAAEAFTYKPKTLYRSGDWKVVFTKGRLVDTCEIISVNNQVSYGLWGDPLEFEIGILNMHRAKAGSTGHAQLTFLPSNAGASAQFAVSDGGQTIMLRADPAAFRRIVDSTEVLVDFDGGAGYRLNAHVPLAVLMRYGKCTADIARKAGAAPRMP